ncbi:MAG: helix-turn-helix domain-containing protein [Calditrichota bacterium]
MINKSELFSRKSRPERISRMMEAIYRCKWSLTVFRLISNDIIRPGEMVRTVEGLTTKVLNECLRRNMEFGILEKKIYPEVPPRVEYHFTEFGHKVTAILNQLEKLQDELIEEVEEKNSKSSTE